MRPADKSQWAFVLEEEWIIKVSARMKKILVERDAIDLSWLACLVQFGNRRSGRGLLKMKANTLQYINTIRAHQIVLQWNDLTLYCILISRDTVERYWSTNTVACYHCWLPTPTSYTWSRADFWWHWSAKTIDAATTKCLIQTTLTYSRYARIEIKRSMENLM